MDTRTCLRELERRVRKYGVGSLGMATMTGRLSLNRSYVAPQTSKRVQEERLTTLVDPGHNQ
jgi:hypothetical protein